MSDPVVPVVADPVVPVVPPEPELTPEEIAELSRLFPFRNEYRDNKEGSAIRERYLPACFAAPLQPLNKYQIAAVPKGWIKIKNADGEIVGACYPNVIYSDDKSRNVIVETFKIELTPAQKLAAIEAEEAKELEALMARMKAKKQAILDAADPEGAARRKAEAEEAKKSDLQKSIEARAARPPA